VIPLLREGFCYVILERKNEMRECACRAYYPRCEAKGCEGLPAIVRWINAHPVQYMLFWAVVLMTPSTALACYLWIN